MPATPQFLDANDIVGGVIAGVIASFVFWTLTVLIRSARDHFQARRFKEIFGTTLNYNEFSLIYAELKCDSDKPYAFSSVHDPVGSFSAEHAASSCEVRAANYVSNAIGQTVRETPSIRSATETQPHLNLNFVSFGGPKSNPKTADAQNNPANQLGSFDQEKGAFVERSGKPLVVPESGFDYAMILKVQPSQFPERIWIACAGLGEWGTSGAAWFLANKWQELSRAAGSKPFVAIIKVNPGQGESALMIQINT